MLRKNGYTLYRLRYSKPLKSSFQLAGREMYYASGTSIRSFPDEGRVLTRVLKDQGQEVIRGNSADGQTEVISCLMSHALGGYAYIFIAKFRS